MRSGGKVFHRLIDKGPGTQLLSYIHLALHNANLYALNIVNLSISQHEMLHRLAHQLNMDYVNATEQMPDIH